MDVDTTLTSERCVELMPELQGCDINISELKGGITNKLYRVSSGRGHDYVVRIFGTKTEIFIDRDIEMRTMRKIEPLRISPKVIHYMPEKNITVIEYIDAYTLKNKDFLREELWEKIIHPIKLVHKSGIALTNEFHPLTEIKKYYKILCGINPDYPEFPIEEMIQQLEEIDNTATLSKDIFVLCHNDLLAENFLLVNDRVRFSEPMYLIDWEYAAMGYCYYEIADMFQEILVPRKVERRLLEIYFEGRDMERNVYLTDLFKPFPDVFWFLWSLIQLNISSIKFDYYTYGKVKFENAQKNVQYLRENYGVKI
jgi:thiamine kinase-like enzyme